MAVKRIDALLDIQCAVNGCSPDEHRRPGNEQSRRVADLAALHPTDYVSFPDAQHCGIADAAA
jgi:hypothetical protein